MAKYEVTMDSMSIKLPRTLSARVAQLARRRNVSRTAIVREALEAYTLENKGPAAASVSDLKGCLKNLPRDLSSNPRHLRGYGE